MGDNAAPMVASVPLVLLRWGMISKYRLPHKPLMIACQPMKDKIKLILEETPSYDAELNLSADQIGRVLNELIEKLEALCE